MTPARATDPPSTTRTPPPPLENRSRILDALALLEKLRALDAAESALEDHNHQEPCVACPKLRETQKALELISREYSKLVFSSPETLRDLLERLVASADPEARRLACAYFNPYELDARADPAMAAMLLDSLDRYLEPDVRSIVSGALVQVRSTAFSEEDLQKIMAHVVQDRGRAGLRGLALISILEGHLQRPSVKSFLLASASAAAVRPCAASAGLLVLLPRDPDAYQAVVSWLDRKDAPSMRMAALMLMRRGFDGVDVGPNNPLLADYLGRLKSAYEADSSGDFRHRVLERLVQFDVPSAAELAAAALRDDSLSVKAKSSALSDLVFLAEDKQPYPHSSPAWERALLGAARDPKLPSVLRVRASMAYLAVVHGSGVSSQDMKARCREVIESFQADPDPAVREEAARLRTRAIKMGVLP